MASLLAVMSFAGAVPVGAASSIRVTTPYPAVAVAPGAKVTLDISIDTDAAGRVGVRVASVPTGWIATLRGGGYAVDSIESNGSSATKLTLDVTVPAVATGSGRLNVVAEQGGASTTLPIDIRIEAAVAGSIAMTTDVPELKGASDATFKFTLNLKNDTPDEQTFTVTSQGPVGWTVDTQVGSQAQAASVVIQAGSSSTVTVNAKPSSDAEAGKYPIAVEATGGSQTAHVDLSVEITGSYAMTISTQNGVLSTNASAGSVTDLTLVVANGGTAPIAGAAVSATAPSGWTVTFDPATVDVPANGSANVVAHMTPSSDAIAGDYMTTFKATAETANASADVRVTVQTSPLWGAVGIGIIALVLIGLLWVFRQFGRR